MGISRYFHLAVEFLGFFSGPGVGLGYGNGNLKKIREIPPLGGNIAKYTHILKQCFLKYGCISGYFHPVVEFPGFFSGSRPYTHLIINFFKVIFIFLPQKSKFLR